MQYRKHALYFLLGLLLLGPAVQATEAPASDRLLGLWGSETVQGLPVQGSLLIDGRNSPWQASLSGFTVPVLHEGDELSFALPGDQGRFRGHLSSAGQRIDGFWIQPPDPMLGSAYATPVVMQAQHKGAWSGHIEPLLPRVSQYLQIERAGDGSLSAYLRNPEFNMAQEHAWTVTADGDAVTFGDPQRPRWALHAHLDEETDQLQVDWQGIGVFAFTRRDRNHAVGFYAHTPETGYRDSPPITMDDGWATTTAADAGLDPGHIAALLDQLQKPAARAAPQVQSLLIARHGRLAVEAYFQGFDSARLHDTRSAGKTFASLLIRLAMQHGGRFSTDTPLLGLLPHYADLANPDPRKAKITVADLMSMTSGLACDDSDDQSPGNEDRMQNQQAQNDWYRYTLDLPMTHDPGAEQADYCSAGINLLGAIVAQTTGQWLPRFFDTYVARPLQIHDYHINLMPSGDAYLAGGIRLRPRDLLKLGDLYLHGGKWNGRRVVDADWVRLSTARHSSFGPNHDYGYGWHLHDFTAGGRTFHEYAAEGNGGQFVMVVPELDLSVVITAGDYGDFKSWYRLQDLMTEFVIPAVLAGK